MMINKEPNKEFLDAKDMAIGLADAIADRLKTIGCWVRLSWWSGSRSVYVIATRIYGEIGNATPRVCMIRLGDHPPEKPWSNTCGSIRYCIDIHNLPYADIEFKSRKDPFSCLYCVDGGDWSKSVAMAFVKVRKFLENNTGIDPDSAVRTLRENQAWDRLEIDQRVEGAICCQENFLRGFLVDLGDAVAVLHVSEAELKGRRFRRETLLAELKNQKQTFKIIGVNSRKGEINVSRREILEEQHAETINNRGLSEGQTVEGVVKEFFKREKSFKREKWITKVDLNGLQGVLRIVDMAWRRVIHPTEILEIGETIKGKVLKINKEHILIGMKQLRDDPWESGQVADMYPPGSTHSGVVKQIWDNCDIVELETDVRGVVPVSNVSETGKYGRRDATVTMGQKVDVTVQKIDAASREMTLSLNL